uniref:ribosomal protein L22 n=1 Tax=Impatiens morsei TaxID=1752760 RepID=UPI0023AABE4E|nr:ribosomal protein L22 [Impatiens morsei]WCD66930.1 ribosomal protein L22 [Impatiens morsei]WCD67004.1 ribosomal protein L22 [Impatiens morsei]
MLQKIKTEIHAIGQHISMSADKARRVIDQIRGRSYEETLIILELMPYRACYPIFKLVYSAAANASYNFDFKETNLIIKKAEVYESTTVKKLKPRARGRSYPVKRPTCHIVIVVMGERRELNPRRVDSQSTALIHLATSAPFVQL